MNDKLHSKVSPKDRSMVSASRSLTMVMKNYFPSICQVNDSCPNTTATILKETRSLFQSQPLKGIIAPASVFEYEGGSEVELVEEDIDPQGATLCTFCQSLADNQPKT